MITPDRMECLKRTGTALCRQPDSGQWGLYTSPVETIRVAACAEMRPALAKLEGHLSRGKWAVGMLSYEASAAFEPEMETFPSGGFPQAVFLLYDTPPELLDIPYLTDNFDVPDFVPELTRSEYLERLDTIRENLAQGNLYQANFTFRCHAKATEEPERLFLNLFNRHPVPYAAFLNLAPEFKILSFSPELFLERTDDNLKSSLMKGTAKRDPLEERDREMAQALSNDPKNRAENLMITDMVRNDFGRICRPGSIRVDPMFHVDTYQTLHQMISTVHGQLGKEANLFDILGATFPPASITGAPKISAVNLLRKVEKSPRGIYTGTIGCFNGNDSFCLNVAIRTLLCTKEKTELGIGGGITWYSDPAAEWEEALLKSRFAGCSHPEFRIFETMFWSPETGFTYLEEHKQRAEASQRFMGRPFRREALDNALEKLSLALAADAQYRVGACVKFLLDRNGEIETSTALPRKPDWKGLDLKLLVSRKRIHSDDLFLYHKTTHREFYDKCFHEAREQGAHEVVFLNEKGELTEGAISNIFLKLDGQWHTPPVACGLLPGIWRARMIRELNARETVMTANDLKRAGEIRIGNSLRGTGIVKEVLF